MKNKAFTLLLLLAFCKPTFADDTADGKAQTVNITDGATQKSRTTVIKNTNSNALAVAITDGTGNQITSFGGGTQYAEGATASTITGTAIMAAGTPTTIVALQADANKNLKVAFGTGSTIKIADTNGNAYPATIPVSISSATVTQSTGSTIKIADANGNSFPSTIPVSLASVPASATGNTTRIADNNGNVYASTIPVSLASVPSHAVTNAGVFATQDTPATGATVRIANNLGNVYGANIPVSVASGQIASGAVASGALASGSIAAGAIATGNSIAINNAPNVIQNSGNTIKIADTNGNVYPTTIPVSLASVPSHAVTNVGTFATQDTPATGATVKIANSSGNVYGATIPTSLASAQVASGAFASGSIGSGAIASGAIASGAVASGALASGSIAAGAIATGNSIAINNSPNVLQGGSWTMQPITGTSGGWSCATESTLTTVAQLVKASAGNFGGYAFYNPNSAVAYLMIYDSSTAAGCTTTTLKVPFGIPATSAAHIEFSNGLAFSNGVYVASANTGNTIVGSTNANTLPITGSIFYK